MASTGKQKIPFLPLTRLHYVGGVMNFLDFKSNEIFSILSQDKRYVQSSEGTL